MQLIISKLHVSLLAENFHKIVIFSWILHKTTKHPTMKSASDTKNT